MSYISRGFFSPPDEVPHQARGRRRTAGETEGMAGAAAQSGPAPWPIFTMAEDGAIGGQLLEQDAAGDWLGIAAAAAAAAAAEATRPSSPLPPSPHRTTPEAGKTAVGAVGGIDVDIGGFAPLAPAADWRSLAAPAWQGPPPRKTVETGRFPYVAPWSAHLFAGARRRLPGDLEAVRPRSAAPGRRPSPEGGGPPTAVAATAARAKRDGAPVVREMPPPPPSLSRKAIAEQPPPGLPSRGAFVPRPPPAIQAPLCYLPVGHSHGPAPPPRLAPAGPPPGYGPPRHGPPTWCPETPGEWWDPRMPAPARGWPGLRRLGAEQRGRVCFRE